MLHHMLRAAAQRAFQTLDPYFQYVTMLLHGDGTNGAQNNTFLDSSTNNFTITRNGNTTQGTFTPYGANWSNYLNGSSYFTFGTTASNFLCTGSATGITATFEAWVFLTAYSTGANSYNFSAIHAKGGVYFNFGVRNGAVRFYWYDGAEKNVTSASTSDVPLNTWTHIALTISGSTIKIYINGVLNTTSATYTGVASAGSGTTEYIGLEVNGTYLNGYISNYRFTNTVVYSAAFTPSTTPLTAVSGTALLTCQSNRFVDNSSNNFTITVAGGSPSVQRFSPFSPTTAYSTSVIGGSGYFDGASDYLTAASAAALGLGSGDFTIELWVYLTANYDATGQGLITASYNTNFAVIGVNTGAGNRIDFYVANTVLNSGANYISLNAWTHLAFVRSSGTTKMYYNGVEKASSASLTGTGAAATVYVGTLSHDIPRVMTGFMTDARIVKGTAVYTAAFTPNTAPLTAITNTSLLLNYTNAGILDNAMMNDLETVGNAQISTSVKKYGTGSLAFDGTGDYLIPNSASSNLVLGLGSGDFTVEFWVYFNSGLGSDIVLYDGRPLSTNGAYPTLYVNSSSQLSYVVSSADRITSASAFSTSTWYHIAVARSGTSTKMFVNGTQVGSTYTDSTNYLSASRRPVIAINGFNETAAPLNGYIDDLRITKGVARYTANFSVPTAAFPNN